MSRRRKPLEAHLLAVAVYGDVVRRARLPWGAFNVNDASIDRDMPLWQMFWPDQPDSIEYTVQFGRQP